MKVLILDKMMPGGLLNKIDKISNYPGLIDIPGPDFANLLLEQVKSFEIPYKLEGVLEIDVLDDVKKVVTSSGEYEAKNVILAMGRKPKYLGLDNERDYLGRGLSTCALCDAYFYKDLPIAVVGTGNSALQEAMYLSSIVSKVYLINRRDGFRGEAVLVDQVKNNEKIEILYNVNIDKINEMDGKISSVHLDNGDEIEVKGVFIYIGYKPDTEFISDLDILDSEGYVDVNQDFETKISGIYAIGDVIKKDVYQLVTAASDGATVIYKINRNH